MKANQNENGQGVVTLPNLLSKLGFKPVNEKDDVLIYQNVLKINSKPSFSVNTKIDAWFDQGSKIGGGLLDFVSAYWPELDLDTGMERAKTLCSQVSFLFTERKRKRLAVKLPCYRIEKTGDIGFNRELNSFLEKQGIWHQVPEIFKEVYYYYTDHKGSKTRFFALGWCNENGGWEVRCAKFNGCLGLRGMTFLEGDTDLLNVFTDINGYILWYGRNTGNLSQPSVLIINGQEFLSAAISRSKQYGKVEVFLTKGTSIDPRLSHCSIHFYDQQLCTDL